MSILIQPPRLKSLSELADSHHREKHLNRMLMAPVVQAWGLMPDVEGSYALQVGEPLVLAMVLPDRSIAGAMVAMVAVEAAMAQVTAAVVAAVPVAVKTLIRDIMGSEDEEPTMVLMVSAVIGGFTAKVVQEVPVLSSSNITTLQRRLHNAHFLQP